MKIPPVTCTLPDSVTKVDLSTDLIAKKTVENAVKALEFFSSHFNRSGIDGMGQGLRVIVHQTSNGSPLNNAYWDPQTHDIHFGDGDGVTFKPLGTALDVVVHETTHGIIGAEVSLPYIGQSGAIHESFSDVMACLSDGNWQIGEDTYTPGVFGDSIRDVSKPKYSHYLEVKGNSVNVHDLSGIPSLAAYRVAQIIGSDQMGKILYRAHTEYLNKNSGFSGAARATLEAAKELFGKQSQQFVAVDDAWKSVGVVSRYKG
jgi:Zn-dependent metalloprotease